WWPGFAPLSKLKARQALNSEEHHGVEKLNSRRFAIAAALIGLAIGIATPLCLVAAGVPSDTGTSVAAEQVLPRERAKTDGVMVVSDKNKYKNWNKGKNWNNKKG